MEISVLAASEVDLIKPLWELLNKTHHSNSINWKHHFANLTFERRLQTILKSEDYQILVSIINDEIVGYCIASINNDIGEIDSIFVKEEYRKSKVGHRLISISLQWLETQNVESIKVAIVEGNDSVLPFYEKLGFKKSMTLLKKV